MQEPQGINRQNSVNTRWQNTTRRYHTQDSTTFALCATHACTQQFVDRSLASVRLSDSFANLDLCVEDVFFLFFGLWIRRTGAIFSLPQLAIDLTDTPTMPDCSRHRLSVSLTTAPGTRSSILLANLVSFEHSVSSPYPVSTSRREERNKKAKVFQHPIDSYSQSPSSCPISPHFEAGAVGVGSGGGSFLATKGTGTVLIPRLMTRIAGHGFWTNAHAFLDGTETTFRQIHASEP